MGDRDFSKLPTAAEVATARKKVDARNGGFSGCAESTSQLATDIDWQGTGWHVGEVAYGIQIGMQITKDRIMNRLRKPKVGTRRG